MKKILLLLCPLVLSVAFLRAQDDPPSPLPPAGTLKVVTSVDYNFGDDEFTPAGVTTDFSVVQPKIYVTLATTAENVTFVFGARLVAVEVKGLAAGELVPFEGNQQWAEITPDKKHNYVEVPFPTTALLPGKYRVEVVENTPAQRVATSMEITAHLPTVPSAESLEVALRPVDLSSDFDESIAPTTDFPTWPGRIFVTVKGPPEIPLSFFPRLVVDNVPGLPSGAILGVLDPNGDQLVNLTADNPTATTALLFPRLGLPPGQYRIEIVEGNAVHRVLKVIPVSTHATALAEAEFNLADSELGGLMESVSGEEGVGYTWAPLLLLRDNRQTWTPAGPPTAGLDFNHLPPNLPTELVISFFQREAALVSAVDFVGHDPDGNFPKEVEIWGSTQSATDGFTKLTAAALEEGKLTARVEVPPTSAKFIKVRVLSFTQPDAPLALVGLHIIEGHADGYVALAKRLPALNDWRLQPRHAAQSGLNFLQPTAVRWQMESACMGCHVQSETLMGMSVAQLSDYRVSKLAERYINDFAYQCQSPNGGFAHTPAAQDQDVDAAGSSFTALAVAYGPRATPDKNQQLIKAAKYLATFQIEDGSLSEMGNRAPIEQGDIMHVSNALEVWMEALKVKEDPALRKAFAAGLNFVAGAEALTTQDKTFKIMSLARFGSAEQKKTARLLALKLEQEQLPDGGWKIESDDKGGSSPFSTGQVLYAFRLAGINPNAAVFRRGVMYLITTQEPMGSWRDPVLSSRFAATMWPVIALAGAFGTKVEPGHIVVTALPRPAPAIVPTPVPTKIPEAVMAAPVAATAPILPKTIEFVLDCSFSMYDRLGKSTRIDTAKQVMRELVEHLPEDTRVGLRLYGHRYDSMSFASAKDTELVVPIGPLNRKAIIDVIEKAQPRGQTPLVYSTLQAGDDLKKIGGGVIIVVTDGEESCGGKPRKAGEQLAALGVPLRLDIIGFTLTGKRVVDDLTAFTQSTGGRYYTASDGAALSKALRDATSPAPRIVPPVVVAAAPPPSPPPEPVIEDFPFEIFDATGAKIASSSTLSGEVPDLDPGIYKVVLHDGAKQAVVPSLKLETSETVDLVFAPATTSLAVKK